ncbi:MKRN2 opposite strand protein [Brevipalpus obovatus]|uniref:MKRN2 opposite strand protein n=1 Tax=Brevipalpus obovatus TaxID=246614 RepID=UPI003D9F9DA2
MGDPKIFCFQHCEPNTKVFCFRVPDSCPLCSASIATTNPISPPFLIPFPFTHPRNSTSSIIIRPTEGDFLNHYRNSADLHIGLTDSKGNVYEFDRNGMHVGTRNRMWNNCLNIPVLDQNNKTWQDYWDHTLKTLIQMPIWRAENYNEDDNNCYTFVITFLRLLLIKDLKPSLASKTQFCKDFIVPRTKNAAKYIALYRKISREGVFAVSTKQPPKNC